MGAKGALESLGRFVSAPSKRNSLSEFDTTLIDEKTIVAPATIGGRMPSAASGIAAVL